MKIQPGDENETAAHTADSESSADPVGRAVGALRQIDHHAAVLLRAVAEAGPVDGLPAARLISLAAGATGWDVRFVRRAAECLSAMPDLWAAFDDGRVSWSQIRGIITAARKLRVADRAELDRLLSGAVAQNSSAEPDRLVELAGDLAGRLDDRRKAEREQTTATESFVKFQPSLLGGADFWGYGDEVLIATLTAALDAAADPPVPDEPAVDADGKVIPAAWRRGTSRDAQRAEALRRVAAAYLGGDVTDETSDTDRAASEPASDRDGHTEPDDSVITSPDAGPDAQDHSGQSQTATATDDAARPSGTPTRARRLGRETMIVITDLDTLTRQSAPDSGVEPVTPRILWNLAGARRATSTAQVRMLSCDSVRVPLLTDGDTPILIGDAYDPIPTALRRAVTTRDQGCRFPGCNAPAAFTDLHHVVFREHGGETSLANLVALCRRCHRLVHQHAWQLTLNEGVLTVARGRYRFTSRPRLRPPPPTTRAGLDDARLKPRQSTDVASTSTSSASPPSLTF